MTIYIDSYISRRVVDGVEVVESLTLSRSSDPRYIFSQIMRGEIYSRIDVEEGGVFSIVKAHCIRTVEKAREMLAMSDKYEYRDIDNDGILEAIPKKKPEKEPKEKPRTETPVQTTPTKTPTKTEMMRVETKTVTQTQVVTKTEVVTETVVQGPGATDIALPVVVAVIVTAIITYLLARRRT
jgi:hypothetical protein